MALGSIVIDLLMRTGSFETDTKRAEKRMAELRKEMDNLGRQAGLAFTAVGAAAVYMGKQIIDGMDALNDVADATGASIENISALEDVALRTGGSLEGVTSLLVKFNNVLKDADGKNGPSQALQRIGLDIDDLKSKDPAEAVLDVAVALSQYADDGDKARLVQELFGKSVKEVGPLLKDLAEKGRLVATVTTDQAKEAERFNQQLAALQKNAVDLGRSLTTDLVIGINNAAKAFRDSGLIEGFRTLFTGDDQFKNAKRMVELTDQLLLAENRLLASRAKDSQFGDRSLETAAAERALAAIKAQIATVQAMQKVLTNGPTGVAPMPTALPSVGPLPTTPPKTPTAPKTSPVKPFATSDRWDAVSAAEAEARMMNEAQEAYAKYNEKVNDANEAQKKLVQTWLDETPEGKLELLRSEMLMYEDALKRGILTEEQYLAIVTARLDLTAEKTEQIIEQLTREQEAMMELGQIGTDALKDLILNGGDVEDVFKNILARVAELIFELTVVEPLLASLRGSMSGGSDWMSTAGSFVAGMFGGARAGGGDVLPGRSYLVGEHGPERFRPRTAGYIAPAGASSGATINITQNMTVGDVASTKDVDARIASANRQLVSAIDRSQRYRMG